MVLHSLALKLVLGLAMGQVDGGWLNIVGERVLPEEVYRAVLVLPPDAGADLETGAEIRHQLSDFLRRSGYELSEVEVTQQEDGGLRCDINEGQLEKIVFQGRLTVQTVRFKLALDVPHDVFNRPSLERQVARLEEKLGLSDIRLELVSTSDLKHVGPQLEQMPELELKGFELIHARRPYELHIVLPERDWDTGLGADLRIGYIDGVELGLNYQGKSGIFDGDRWRVAAGGGVGLRERIAPDGSASASSIYANFSRTSAEGHYLLPRVFGRVRPAVEVMGELLARQRRDLNLENYYAIQASGALELEWEPRDGIRLQLGGGLAYRRLFGFTPGVAEMGVIAPGVEPETRLRPFVAVHFDFTFDPQNERWDRHHMLLVDLQQQFPGPDAAALARASYRYQNVIPFGWHDLWIRSSGYVAWYQTTFHDEESLGEFLRGAFGGDFVRRAGSFGTEFRFSITRDVLKLSVFSEAALYTEVDRLRDSGPVRVAFSGGPGAHVLLEGLFQLDIYVAFGLRPVGTAANPERFAVAVSALLQKAF